ncbi:FtsX-like permease family protein [Streptomyces clavifer]|uniref:FtsX-like permease family protein n=1 Tax=Streptomyces clavifer TaxID=68188 RepID=UPI0036A37F60
MALLHAIGATSRQLAAALVAEGAVVGLLAGSVGVLAAWGGGQIVPLVAGRLGHDLFAPSQVPLAEAALTVAGTALLAVLAVLAPSLSASGSPRCKPCGARQYPGRTRREASDGPCWAYCARRAPGTWHGSSTAGCPSLATPSTTGSRRWPSWCSRAGWPSWP